jgi:hypothetical protein
MQPAGCEEPTPRPERQPDHHLSVRSPAGSAPTRHSSLLGHVGQRLGDALYEAASLRGLSLSPTGGARVSMQGTILDPLARRVRKFGRCDFQGNRGRAGRRASGSGGRGHAGDGRSTFSLVVSNAQAPNGFAKSGAPARARASAASSTGALAIIGHPDGTKRSPLTTPTPARIALRCPPLWAKLRPKCRRPPVQDFAGNPAGPNLRTLRDLRTPRVTDRRSRTSRRSRRRRGS